MESDSENDHDQPSTRSRNSSLSSTDDPMPGIHNHTINNINGFNGINGIRSLEGEDNGIQVSSESKPSPSIGGNTGANLGETVGTSIGSSIGTNVGTLGGAVGSENLRRRNVGNNPGSSKLQKQKSPREDAPSSAAASINYHGVTLPIAAAQGNLPMTVLLWGRAVARRVNLLFPDKDGNNPVHCAALAETPEVLGFLMQHSRGFLNPDTRLVDTRNAAGETPLLRAASQGRIAVIKSLLEEGSDPLAEDSSGQNVFLILARFGHLYCLHYFHSYVSDKYGARRAWEMLLSIDRNDHSALDLAAHHGSINVIEYLIRRGVDPFRVDTYHRSSLYWAAMAGKYAACRFLVFCGCDPNYEDSQGVSPMHLAIARGDAELVGILRTTVPDAMKTLGLSAQSNILSSGQSGESIVQSTLVNPPLAKDRPSKSNVPPDVELGIISPCNEGFTTIATDVTPSAHSGNDTVTPSPPVLLSSFRTRSLNSSLSSTSSTNSHRASSQSIDSGPLAVGNSIATPTLTLQSSLSNYKLDGPMIVSYEDQLISKWWQLVGCYYYWIWSLCNGAGDRISDSNRESNAIRRKSKAIYRMNQTRINYAFCYGFFVLVYWLLTMCIPAYAYAIIVVLSALGMRQCDEMAATIKKSAKRSDERKLSEWLEFSQAKERFVGLYIGTLGAMIFYWMYCLAIWINSVDLKPPTLSATKGSVSFSIAGTSGGIKSPELFFVTAAILLIAVWLWARLVWFEEDPGSVDTRFDDFEGILQTALKSGGVLPGQEYCRSLLVRKPIRSKYCSATGLVVARMDHYCIWLNNSIGHGNHRIFILFLVFHIVLAACYIALIVRCLIDEIGSSPRCGVLEVILGSQYFFVTVLCGFLCLVLIGLAMLLIDQTRNIIRNTTTNEKINFNRYPWMVTDTGLQCNRFDRGILVNCLEFWQWPGYAIDYLTIFEIPNSNQVVTAMSSAAANGITVHGSVSMGSLAGIPDTAAQSIFLGSSGVSLQQHGEGQSSGSNQSFPQTETSLAASSSPARRPIARPLSGSQLVSSTNESSSSAASRALQGDTGLINPGIVRSSSDTAVTTGSRSERSIAALLNNSQDSKLSSSVAQPGPIVGSVPPYALPPLSFQASI